MILNEIWFWFLKLEPQVIIEIIATLVQVISILVSVILVIVQLNRNANLHLKSLLSDKRPLIIASLYPNMDFECKNKTRSSFKRYIAKTLYYRNEAANQNKQESYAFFRIRNESNNHAHNVKISFRYIIENNSISFKEPFTINIIAAFTEYLFFIPLPENCTNCEYLDEYKVDITYYSIAGEKIEYCCSYVGDSKQKVVNIYNGTYKGFFGEKNTFDLFVPADIIETIEK